MVVVEGQDATRLDHAPRLIDADAEQTIHNKGAPHPNTVSVGDVPECFLPVAMPAQKSMSTLTITTRMRS